MRSIMQATAYMLIYMAIQMAVMSMAAMACGSAGDAFMTDNLLGIAALSNALALSAAAITARLRGRRLSRAIRLERVKTRDCIPPCAAALAYSIAIYMLTHGMKFEGSAQIQLSVWHYSGISPQLGMIMQVLSLLIMAPLAEEVLCRGLMLTALRREHGKIASAVLSGLLFGTMHLLAGGGALAAVSAGMGMLLAAAVISTGSLLPAIAAHMLANLPDLILPLMPCPPDAVRYVIAASAFAVVAGIYAGCRDKRQMQ